MANFPSVLTKHFRESGYDPLDNRAYLPMISGVNESPVVFAPIELPVHFYHQTQDPDRVQLSTFKLGKLQEPTLIHSITVKLDNAVNDLRLRVSNLSSNAVIGYYPSLSSWDTKTGIPVGSGSQTINLDSLLLPANAEIAFDFEGTGLVMLGRGDLLYFTTVAQRGTLRTVITDSTLLDGDTPINHRGILNDVLEVTKSVTDIEMAQSNILYCDCDAPATLSLPIIKKGHTSVLEANEVRSGHSWMITNVGADITFDLNQQEYMLGRNTWIGLVGYISQQQLPRYIITCSGSV